MSPSRPPPRGYRTPRRRAEVIHAVLGVAVILAVAIALIWVLAPHEDEPIDLPPIIPQTELPTPTTLPGVTTVPAATTSSTPPG